MASRNIEHLAKELQPLASKFLQTVNIRLAPLGATAIITCTYRSLDEQAELYALGRTKPGKRVTNAAPGQSKHNAVDAKTNKPAARAFDIAILVGGKLNWDIEADVWQVAGTVGEQLGLEWAGRWKRFREGPHFQLKD